MLQKVVTFKSFFYLSYRSTLLVFFVTVLFKYFIRQTLTDDFWGFNTEADLKKSVAYKKSVYLKIT